MSTENTTLTSKKRIVVVSFTIFALLTTPIVAFILYDRLVYCPRNATSDKLLRQIVLAQPSSRTAEIVRLDLHFTRGTTTRKATTTDLKKINSFLSHLRQYKGPLLSSNTDIRYFDSFEISARVTEADGTQAEILFMRDGFIILAGRMCTGEDIITSGDVAVLWIYQFFDMPYPGE